MKRTPALISFVLPAASGGPALADGHSTSVSPGERIIDAGIIVAGSNSGSLSASIGGGLWTSLGGGGVNPHDGDDQASPVLVGTRGFSVAFDEVPMNIFVKVMPALKVFLGIGAFGLGGISPRFYF